MSKTWNLFFANLEKLKNMDWILCKFKKAQKTWIWCFTSTKKLKKHDFNFLQASKSSKFTHLIFLQALKKLKKHEFNFLRAWKLIKKMRLIFCKLKKRNSHAEGVLTSIFAIVSFEPRIIRTMGAATTSARARLKTLFRREVTELVWSACCWTEFTVPVS